MPGQENTSRLTAALEGIKKALDEQRPQQDTGTVRLMKQAGLFLSTGGIAGVFGNCIGATQSQIAALTLGVICILFVIGYRESLQRFCRSWILIASFISILLFAIIFREQISSAILSYTLSKTTGIVEYHPKANDFLPKISSHIERAKEEIWLTGMSFYITLPANKDLLLKKIEEGLSVRFLVYDPTDDDLEEVAKSFSQTKEELYSECASTIVTLQSMATEVSQRNLRGSLEVRLFSTIPKTRIYIFDRKNESGHTFFIPHVDQQNSPNLPGFLIKNVKTGIGPPYFEGVEKLWRDGKDLKHFTLTAVNFSQNSTTTAP